MHGREEPYDEERAQKGEAFRAQTVFLRSLKVPGDSPKDTALGTLGSLEDCQRRQQNLCSSHIALKDVE